MSTVLINKKQGWKNVLNIIIPYFFIVGICQSAGYYLMGFDFKFNKNFQETTKQLFVIIFFNLIGTFITIWLFRKYVDKKSFSSLGFKKSFIKKDIFIGLFLGFIIMLLGFACLVLSNQIEFLGVTFSTVDFILSVGLFLFIAVSEELLLRGYILNNLMLSFNKYIALIISSLIFSLLHAANPNFNFLSFFSLFMAGLFFGLGYIYTKNLWFPIALHFSWNFFQGTIFGFNVSGKDTFSIIITKIYASNSWNGGGFGFEGSILSLFFQLIAIVFIILFFKNRQAKNTFDYKENK